MQAMPAPVISENASDGTTTVFTSNLLGYARNGGVERLHVYGKLSNCILCWRLMHY